MNNTMPPTASPICMLFIKLTMREGRIEQINKPIDVGNVERVIPLATFASVDFILSLFLNLGR